MIRLRCNRDSGNVNKWRGENRPTPSTLFHLLTFPITNIINCALNAKSAVGALEADNVALIIYVVWLIVNIKGQRI